MRVLTRNESAVFFILTYGLPLSVTFVRPDQAAAPFQILTRVKDFNVNPFESTS